MALVIPFEERAVARLQERLGAAKDANEDLIAFARGHSGAVAAIHEAVIAAMEADSLDALLHVVIQEWPLILGLDAVALALIVGDKGFRADGNGVQQVDAKILARSIQEIAGVAMHTVERGNPLFGPASDLIHAEALIRIECGPGATQTPGSTTRLPVGLIALGQRTRQDVDARHGSELLMFLGRSLGAIIRRWLIDPRT